MALSTSGVFRRSTGSAKTAWEVDREEAKSYVKAMTKKFAEQKASLAKRKRKYGFEVDVKSLTKAPSSAERLKFLPTHTLVRQRRELTENLDLRWRVF